MTEPSIKQQGLEAIRKQRFDEAVAHLEEAARLDPSDAETRALLGIAFSHQGLTDQATASLEAAAALAPHNPEYRFYIGAALERAGDRNGAVAAYQAVLQVQPDHAQTRQRLAVLSAEASGSAGLESDRPVTTSHAAEAAPTRAAVGSDESPPQFLIPGSSDRPVTSVVPAKLQYVHVPAGAEDDAEEMEDSFSPVRAFQYWLEILTAPARFFGRRGLGTAPLPLLMFALLMGILSVPGSMFAHWRTGEWPFDTPAVAPFVIALLMPLGTMVGSVIPGAAIHMTARGLGGVGTFAASCSSLIYSHLALAPIRSLLAVPLLLLPQAPPQELPATGSGPRNSPALASPVAWKGTTRPVALVTGGSAGAPGDLAPLPETYAGGWDPAQLRPIHPAGLVQDEPPLRGGRQSEDAAADGPIDDDFDVLSLAVGFGAILAGLISTIWLAVLMVISIRAVHRLNVVRSLIAVSLPFGVLVLLLTLAGLAGLFRSG